MIDVLQGDVFEKLREIPDGSVHCCVTSPPYWNLRSYLPKDHPDKHREIGSEPTPEAYVEKMVEVFREVRRCLHESGTVWLNVGDSYATQGGRGEARMVELGRPSIGALTPPEARGETSGTKGGDGLKPKDLCLIPWRLAIALQADGWWVRSIICWAKKSCMPESVTDRPTNSWEPIFLLAKSASYFYDYTAVMEPAQYGEQHANKATSWGTNRKHPNKANVREYAFAGENHTCHKAADGGYSRNLRNVWSLGPEPYSEAHFATFPTEIPRRAILAGTSAKGCCPKCRAPWERVTETSPMVIKRSNRGEKIFGGHSTASSGMMLKPAETRTLGWQPTCTCNAGEPIPCTVADIFAGSGTVGQVALELARHAVLIELNPDYIPLIQNRIQATTPGLNLA